MGEIAEDMVNGWCCSLCMQYFEEEHGYPVLCKNCWRTSVPEERAGLQKATIKEA